MKVKSESEVVQLCPTLRDPMDCSPPGSSIHGIFQARVLEWGAIAFSKLVVKYIHLFCSWFCGARIQGGSHGHFPPGASGAGGAIPRELLHSLQCHSLLVWLLHMLGLHIAWTSQEAGQVLWYSHLFQNFLQFVVIHTVRGFGIVSQAEVDVFSWTLLLFWWPNGYWHFNLWFLCLF